MLRAMFPLETTENFNKEERRMKISKSTTKLLCAALVLILLGSILASVFNGGSDVKVTRIQFDTDNGTLSGLLYMPKDASAI